MGGGSGNIRSRKVIPIIESLEISSGKFTFERGGKHWKIKPIFCSERSFPLPLSHKFINVFILKELAKRFERWGVCAEEEFLERLK